MNRLIAVVIALVLSACSYDPYHYYAFCNSGDNFKYTYRYGIEVDRERRNVPATYFHNGVLHNLNNRRDEPYYFFVKEDEHGLIYASRITKKMQVAASKFIMPDWREELNQTSYNS